MKKSTVLAIIGGTLIIGLVLLNIWLTIQDRYQIRLDFNSAIQTYKAEDEKRTNQLITEAIAQISTVRGDKGDTGASGLNGKDGKDGENIRGEKGDTGAPGQPGKDAKQIVLSTDSLTGDVMWKYEDDTLWSLLIEGCQLKGECDD